MPSISPITDKLNYSARRMIESVAKNEPSKTTHIRDFFRTANDNNLQGPALISYFTEVNKAKYGKKSSIAEKMYGFTDLMEDTIKSVPELIKLCNKFANEFIEKYPNTYILRRALAHQSAVTSDRVEPKSFFKKLMSKIEYFVDTDV